MTILKRKRKVTRPDGTTTTSVSRCWYIQWRDARGKIHRRKGYTDKAATRQLAAKLEAEQARGEQSMVDVYRDHRTRPIGEHLDDYLAHLEAQRRDDDYRYHVDRRCRLIIDQAHWRTLDDVTLDSFLAWRNRRAKNGSHNGHGIEKGKPLTARTLNHYRDAVRGFLNWCVEVKRMPVNPLANVAKVTGEKRINRRALTVEEVGRLLNTAPADRRFAWLFLLTTGLRCQEAADLQWRDVQLMATRPYLQLRMEATKAKRADRVWLRPEVADELRAMRPSNCRGTDAVFDRFPSLKWWKSDLAAAGVEYRDDSGRQADRHATRMTLGTMLQQAGVSPRAAQDVLRHATLRQTLEHYTDGSAFDTVAAVDSLPALDRAAEAGDVRFDVQSPEKRPARAANA
ncbi:MAG: tyrosine-type recombinase/integrase [Planctomycetota bacterium]